MSQQPRVIQPINDPTVGSSDGGEFSWDCLVGMLVIEEAGGFTNDFLAGNGLIDGNQLMVGPKPPRAERERLTAHWR